MSGQLIGGGGLHDPGNVRSLAQLLEGPASGLEGMLSTPWDATIPFTGVQGTAPGGTGNLHVLSLLALELTLSGTGGGS